MRAAHMRLALDIAVLAVGSPAAAQRSVAPVDVSLTVDAAHAYQARVSVVARVEADIVADVRFVHLDVRPTGVRRAMGCDAPSRPRHPEIRHPQPTTRNPRHLVQTLPLCNYHL